MAPKKKVEAEEPPPPVEEVAEPEPPEITTRCFRTPGGLVYAGECQADGAGGVFLRQGRGRQVYTAKNVAGEDVIVGSYEGVWEKDAMHGQGTYKWPDGSVYKGDFRDGVMHGSGKYVWPDGSTYEGSWKEGRMGGKGRFDSKSDGDFMMGRFNRNCYQHHDGRWIDVCGVQAASERKATLAGDASAVPLRRCDAASLAEVLAAVQEEGLVPFLVADASTARDAAESARAASVLDPTSSVKMSEAALCRRRSLDVKGLFYGAVQAALLRTNWLSVIFDDDGVQLEPPDVTLAPGSASAASRPPEEWWLRHYMDPVALPLEAFQPTLFNGRMGFVPFLPPDLHSAFAASTRPRAPAVEAAADAGGAAAAGGAEAAPPEGAEGAPVADTTPRVYHLRLMLVALARLPAGLSNDEARELVVGRYGACAPLHRTALVLLTSADERSPDLS